MAAEQTDESRLIARCRRGDGTAFGELVERHKPRVLAVCFHILGNVEDAKDVAQETFVHAFLGLERFRQNARFSTWLYRIAVNLSLNVLRRRPQGVAPLDESVPDHGMTPERVFAGRERGRRVRRALERLSPELRVAVVLRDGLGFSYAEIAECTEVPLGTVKSRISAARWMLRDLLRGVDDV